MNGKAYPREMPREEREAKGIWYQKWRGCASAILNQEEAEYLQSLLECLYGRDDVSEELGDELESLQDAVIAILRNGEGRMQALHGVLGGYDLAQDGSISKPEEDRIKWEDHEVRSSPELRLIKTEQ
ncbi:MAG: hypothetical protein AWU57_456 [Marinobacter sp. T13-3]|nr:MAG: hypothetical protein AWU57_456 [Marinobacter sp. T13-3]